MKSLTNSAINGDVITRVISYNERNGSVTYYTVHREGQSISRLSDFSPELQIALRNLAEHVIQKEDILKPETLKQDKDYPQVPGPIMPVEKKPRKPRTVKALSAETQAMVNIERAYAKFTDATEKLILKRIEVVDAILNDLLVEENGRVTQWIGLRFK